MKLSNESDNNYAMVPMQSIGPFFIKGVMNANKLQIPLATYEIPLWHSVKRGALITYSAGGINTVLLQDKMVRSIVLKSNNASNAQQVVILIKNNFIAIQKVAASTSRFIELEDLHSEILGNLIYLRFSYKTSEAAGHNMTTKASDEICFYLLDLLQNNNLPAEYVSVSANICVDKKVSAINGILGRGKSVIAEVWLSKAKIKRYLHTTPEKIYDLHIKKNLLGSNLAGSIRSANAHVANMLLAFYIAIGQDAANIVEGSQAIDHLELIDGGLYFSCNLPNIILGAIGNGKTLDFVKQNLKQINCLPNVNSNNSNEYLVAQKLSAIAASVCLAGEVSLLAAQTNPRELVSSHLKLER